MNKNVLDKIVKAKSALICDQPFFASLLLAMPMSESSGISTLATDGDNIIYNPDFMDALTLHETIFVLAHETMHCVFMHMYRKGQRNHNKWNIAGDYIINDLLVTDNVGHMPKGCLYDKQLVVNGHGTTEGVYNLLPKDCEDKKPGDKDGPLDDIQMPTKPSGGQGKPGDGNNGCIPLDPSEIAAKEAEKQVQIIQAANAAKMCGKFSKGLARIVKEATATRVDWKDILRRFISERTKTNLSYAKPKRRFMADDITLPSLQGEKLGGIVVAIDCSGSIDDKMLVLFGAELKGIVEDTAPYSVDVVYFDSKISHHDHYDHGQAIEVNSHGGGGTDFRPIFSFIDKNNISPIACVVLTDLDCPNFGPVPSYPVLWASTYKDKAPFGEVIRIKE